MWFSAISINCRPPCQVRVYSSNAFLRNEHVLAVFFDLEKAYDTTWRYGILRQLHDWGIRGHMAHLISNFVRDRYFRVRVGDRFSERY